MRKRQHDHHTPDGARDGRECRCCCRGGAWAQTFPAQTIRIVVPYPPAGPTDALARIIAQELQAANGWTVVVDNKPGASGALGSREVAQGRAGRPHHRRSAPTRRTPPTPSC